MTRRTRTAAGVAALAAMGLGVAGCSSAPPTLTAAELQESVTARMAEDRQEPRSVSCPEGLTGEVGREVRCEVDLSENENVEALVTVTAVQDGEIDYKLTPQLTQEELERRLGALDSVESV